MDLGLAGAEIVSSRSGLPTLMHGGQAILSTYDPAREAARFAKAYPQSRIRLVGLGLGYLAQAFSGRLAGILAIEGEEGRLTASRPDAAEALRNLTVSYGSLLHLERALAGCCHSGETPVLDPSLGVSPELKARLEDLIAMIAKRPRVTVIHLKTAGDVLRCLAAVQAYKNNFPQVDLTFVTEKPYGELVSLATGIDRIVEVDPGAPSVIDLPRPFIAFNFGGDHAACALMKSMEPVYSAGYAETESGIQLVDDRRADQGAELNEIRNRMNRYALAHAIMGLAPTLNPPFLKITAKQKDYSVVQFGAGSGAEVWDPKRVDPGIIGECLRELGGKWIAVGSQGERDRARDGGIAEDNNFCGRTSWSELAELIAGARLYIGHDSGPTHLAAALGVPTVALFGFTSPILNAPVGPRTIILQADMPCAYFGCRIPCPERTCTHHFTPRIIGDAVAFLNADRPLDRLTIAERLRSAGMRYWTSCLDTDDPDPLRALFAGEPEIGPPGIPALSLLREWLRTGSR